jgi:hypothetical protein
MSTFHRSGFWRRGPSGNRHWVREHSVERDEWGRSSPSAGETYHEEFLRTSEARYGFSSRLVIPNAQCPVCGEKVFFYQNDHGSKVWFDELGPPWPKHPCFEENHEELQSYEWPNGVVIPQVRNEVNVAWIRYHRAAIWDDPEADFIRYYKSKPWTTALLKKRVNQGRRTWMILRENDRNKPRTLYLVGNKIPKSLKSGACVFINKNRLSFFEPCLMTTEEVTVTKLRNAKCFVDDLAGINTERGQ